MATTDDILETEDAFEAIAEDRIDREKGVIRGVKLLGLRSKNKRSYDTKGVRETAIKLLPGSPIYIDHPKSATDSRSIRDRLGVVGKKVEYRVSEGYFGDILFNPKNDVAEQLVWDVLNAPKSFGMSINSSVNYADDGKPNKSGDKVVESIQMMRSLDVVTRPGTTDGIFEQEEVEEEIMDLKTLQEKHPELVNELLAKNSKNATEQAELEAAKKESADLKIRLDAMEAEAASTKLKTSVSVEINKAFEGVEIEKEMLDVIIECACEMDEATRKKLNEGFLSKLGPMLVEIPDLDEDEEAPVKEEVEEEEKPEPKPFRHGKKKSASGSYNLLSSIGLK